ncbi:expressed unknown protein [Seminavis robusta]|uniref:Uncharacterized protein n=1 Tax=Seminavis robusta TaxID=568900 RepID=A0A9N8DMS6_9STRA|nr:expressed unknown protein [Seminavis robusta]|eukprot:Sro164_g073681.1  (134) ;mRNA; f:71606-72236
MVPLPSINTRLLHCHSIANATTHGLDSGKSNNTHQASISAKIKAALIIVLNSGSAVHGESFVIPCRACTPTLISISFCRWEITVSAAHYSNTTTNYLDLPAMDNRIGMPLSNDMIASHYTLLSTVHHVLKKET